MKIWPPGRGRSAQRDSGDKDHRGGDGGDGSSDCDGDCEVMKSCVVLVVMLMVMLVVVLVVIFQMHHGTGDGDQTS